MREELVAGLALALLSTAPAATLAESSPAAPVAWQSAQYMSVSVRPSAMEASSPRTVAGPVTRTASNADAR